MSVIQVASICEYLIVNSRKHWNAKKNHNHFSPAPIYLNFDDAEAQKLWYCLHTSNYKTKYELR